MSGHTPGPWIIAEAVENKHQKTDMRRVRSSLEGTNHGAVCEVYGIRDGSIAQANARLIAAAPELLEACELFAAYDNGDPDDFADLMLSYNRALTAARAAIAKATGERP